MQMLLKMGLIMVMKWGTEMELKTLYKLQKKLDERVDYTNEDQFLILKTSLRVEISEMLNEWRVFKVWSKDREPRKGKLLEEYVDGLHFILSLGIYLKIEPSEATGTVPNNWSILQQVEHIHKLISKQPPIYYGYKELLKFYLGLGKMLGFSDEDIVQAYMDKNKKNHERWTNDY